MAVVELTDERIEEIRSEHGAGQCGSIEGPEDQDGQRQIFVVRKPTLDEWREIQRDLKDDSKAAPAMQAFCAKMCIFPGPGEMASTCNEWPAFCQRVEELVTLCAGYDPNTEVKKVTEPASMVEKYGALRAIRGPEKTDGTRDVFMVRKPTRVEWMHTQRDLKNDTKASRATAALCEKLCVAPGSEAMAETCREWPGFAGFVSDVINEIAGYDRAAEVKKI